jgi:hypothetical protein
MTEQNILEPMNETRAVQILVDAVMLAQKRGAFFLMETPDIVAAVKRFTQRPQAVSNGAQKEELQQEY